MSPSPSRAMDAHRGIPQLLLAILTVLAIGGAALGVVLAPPTANAKVANASANILGAPAVTMHERIVESVAGRQVTGPARSAVLCPATDTTVPASAAPVLTLIEDLQSHGPWDSVASVTPGDLDLYQFAGSLEALIPQITTLPAQSHTTFRVTVQGTSLSGFTLVIHALEQGHVVTVQEHFRLVAGGSCPTA